MSSIAKIERGQYLKDLSQGGIDIHCTQFISMDALNFSTLKICISYPNYADVGEKDKKDQWRVYKVFHVAKGMHRKSFNFI